MNDLRAGLLFLLALAAAPALAQVYRWVDAKGTIHYSNVTPPQGVRATLVDIDPKPVASPPESAECHTIRCQGERLEQRLARREELEARQAAEHAAATPPPPNGLDFRKYVSLQRGMGEAQMLGITGKADMVVDQGVALAAPATVQIDRQVRAPARAGLRMKNYIWLPTPADPFTTTVTVVGGRISEIERERKF